MIDLEHKWRFRQNDAVKFERVDGAEDWWQIEALAPKGNHPIHLDYAGKNLPPWKMAVEIKEIYDKVRELRAITVNRVLASMLVQVSAYDPLSLTVAAAALVGAALFGEAALVQAKR